MAFSKFRPSDSWRNNGPAPIHHTTKIRKMLYKCTGRQIVLRHYKIVDKLMIHELGEHCWTRQPNPSKISGVDTSRFDCGLSWETERNRPAVLPITFFRDGMHKENRYGKIYWVAFVPANLEPYSKTLGYLPALQHQHIPGGMI